MVAINSAFVKIWGETVGAIFWDETNGLGSFEYDKAFAGKGIELSPLKMPIAQTTNVFKFPELLNRNNEATDTFKGLPGLLADVLPDKYGNQLIDTWLAQNGRAPNSMNPVEQLCYIGTRGMGALEFEPSQQKPNIGSVPLDLSKLVDIAQKMLEKREGFGVNLIQDEKEAMREILRIGTSAGGARPKAIITYNQKSGEVRSGQAHAPVGFEHWLIKLDGVSDAQFGESSGYGSVEMAYYLMAIDCGIEMMECNLLEENGRSHFMTKRFDRTDSNTKHHVQTWCGLQHFDFNDVNSYSYEQLFQTMRILRLPYPQAEQMYRRMVFNVIARNCDDHTKNFAFRLKKGERWELAPAYDICHAYRPGSVWVSQHALSINGKRNNISRQDLLKVAESMNIKNSVSIINDTNKVVSKWETYANKSNVIKILSDRIKETLLQI